MTSEPRQSEDEIRALLDSYREFRLSNEASPSAIKHRYRLLAKKWHPDKHADRPESLALAKEKMRVINACYLLIKDAPLRGRSGGGTHSPRRSRPNHYYYRCYRWVDSEPVWERACPNCGAPVRVRGVRYAHCNRCSVGFFPTNEGPFEDPVPLTLPQKVALVGLAVLIAAVEPPMAAIVAGLLTLALVAWEVAFKELFG